MKNISSKNQIHVFNYNYLKSKNSLLANIHMLLALVVIAWMNNGLCTYAMPYVPAIVRYILYFLWFGMAIGINQHFLKKFFNQAKFLIFFNTYMLFISLFVNMDLMVQIKSISYLIMVYSIFIYYYNNNRYVKFQKYLCYFLIFDWTFVGINTYFQLQKNPLLARFLSTDIETREKLLGQSTFLGVGSYPYFYALVGVILLLAFLFLNQRKRKILLLLTIIFALLILLKSSFTIAIILAIIFIILIIMLKYMNKYIVLNIVLMGVILLFIFRGVFAYIFIFFADAQGIPTEVSIRLTELANFLSNLDISGTDLSARFRLYLESIEAFVDNILFGIVLKTDGHKLLGNHSAWLDLLGTFGLFSILFFMFLYEAYKHCKKSIPKHFLPFVNIYWLYFICLGFINTLLFAPIYTVWFLFLPMFINANYQRTRQCC